MQLLLKRWYLVVAACVVGIAASYGAINEACFLCPPNAGNRPLQCVGWQTDCKQSDGLEGQCSGIYHIRIGRLTYAFFVMSCGPATESTAEKCEPYPETGCDTVGTLNCLSYTVYNDAACTQNPATMYQTSIDCDTDINP